MVLGIAIRLVQLLNGRPLWLDEAMLALNIIPRGFRDFFRPLEESQLSPLGFLWLESVLRRLAGTGEVALRAVPFAAGAGALIAFARLARRLLNPAVALVAVVTAALSPLLIEYSAELKSYGLDVLTMVLLVHATLDCADPGRHRRALRRWAVVAAGTALVSIPAPFIVGGCALALVLSAPGGRDPRFLFQLGVASAPAALIFLGQMLTLYHSPATTSFMRDYWAGSFLAPHPVAAAGDLIHAAHNLWLRILFGNPAPPPLGAAVPVVLGVSAVGTWALARSDRLALVALLAPVALALVASLAHYWPLAPRLLLFAAPAVLVTLAAGLATVAGWAPSRASVPVFAGIALVVASAEAVSAWSEIRNPPHVQPLPEAMAYVGTHAGRDATVYLSRYLVPACRYYSVWHPNRARLAGDATARECSIGGVRTIRGEWPPSAGSDTTNTGAPEAEVTAWVSNETDRMLRGATPELWLIIQEGPKGGDQVVPALERLGAVRLAERPLPGIVIYRYRLRGT